MLVFFNLHTLLTLTYKKMTLSQGGGGCVVSQLGGFYPLSPPFWGCKEITARRLNKINIHARTYLVVSIHINLFTNNWPTTIT